MRNQAVIVTVSLVLSLGVGEAQAQPGMTPPTVTKPGPEHRVALSVSAARAVAAILEVQGEFRVGDKISVVGLLGAGRPEFEQDDGTMKSVKIAEAGAQFRYYVFSSFDGGLHAGAQLAYLYVTVEEATEATIQGEGLVAAPFIGYKHTFGFGLTLEAQGGVSFAAARAKQEGSSGIHHGNGVWPHINANVGYSF